MNLKALKAISPPNDVCEHCNTASLRIQRSFIAYENDDNPDTPTQGYTLAVISCVNPDCKEHNKPRFGGAEPMGLQSTVLFCECGQMISETVAGEVSYKIGVELYEVDTQQFARCECGKEYQL